MLSNKHEVLLGIAFFQTIEWTKEVANKSRTAKNDALNLFNDVNNLQVPEINVPELQKKSDGLRTEAQQLLNESERLYLSSEELINLVEDKNEKARELLDEAYYQQDRTDELLTDIYGAKEVADKAINRWNAILNETESIYKDLKGEQIYISFVEIFIWINYLIYLVSLHFASVKISILM